MVVACLHVVNIWRSFMLVNSEPHSEQLVFTMIKV
jgi:hypothetical protein